jgi:pimeloyl-ACP methyl ester carboxylesterase
MNHPHMIEKLWVQALRLLKFESRIIDVDDGKLHALVVKGSGKLPPLLMLHGLGANAAGYAPLILLLRKHFQEIIVPDFPGHGLTPPPKSLDSHEHFYNQTTQGLRKLIQRPVLVFGNSMGGGYAWDWALQNPELTLGLFLLSPAGSPTSELEFKELTERFAIKTVRQAHDMAKLVTYDLPEPVAWFLAPILKFSLTNGIIRDLLDSIDPSRGVTPEQFATLKMPILVLWGQAERLLPDSHLRYLEAHLPPQAVIERPANFGHCPYMDRPMDVVRYLLDFAQNCEVN